MLHYQQHRTKLHLSSLTRQAARGGKKQLYGAKKRIRIYSGQYYDSETGLHYNYHRYYDPKLGRYLRADPIGLEGGINLYSYVHNNPLVNVDPYGLETLTHGMQLAEIICGCSQKHKSQERKRYKKRCNESPPTGLDPCELARWKLRRNQDCLRMRIDFSNKWYGDNDAGHVNAIDDLRRSIEKLKRWIEENCCGK